MKLAVDVVSDVVSPERQAQDARLEGSIQAMEMAFRVQFSAPEAFDLRKESVKTLAMRS
jgi:predicted DsbA family dithiol-disulfide isomerase